MTLKKFLATHINYYSKINRIIILPNNYIKYEVTKDLWEKEVINFCVSDFGELDITVI